MKVWLVMSNYAHDDEADDLVAVCVSEEVANAAKARHLAEFPGATVEIGWDHVVDA